MFICQTMWNTGNRHFRDWGAFRQDFAASLINIDKKELEFHSLPNSSLTNITIIPIFSVSRYFFTCRSHFAVWYLGWNTRSDWTSQIWRPIRLRITHRYQNPKWQRQVKNYHEIEKIDRILIIVKLELSKLWNSSSFYWCKWMMQQNAFGMRLGRRKDDFPCSTLFGKWTYSKLFTFL
jgi:hypothetical protein